MKLNILFAVHGYKPAYRIGGPIHSVSALSEKLVQRGHRVTVFTTNSNLDEDLDVPEDQPVDVNGVEVWYFRRKEPLKQWLPFIPYLSQSMGFLYAPAMRAALDRTVPLFDLVHTHIPFVYPTYAASRAAIRYRKPLFYHQRGVFDPGRLRFRGLKKRLFIRAFERPAMKQAASLIALTQAEVESYRALGVDTPCHVIPNGVDVSKHRVAPRSDVSAWLKVPPDALVILFLGRIHPTKGADRLLEAFVGAQSHCSNAYLVIAGPDECGLQDSLRRSVSSDIRKRVLFPGMVTGEERLDLLARADLFCLPSDAEGFSMAVLEALASSTAVLLSPNCHFPEVVPAGAGCVVSAQPEHISAALCTLLQQPERLRTMGVKGRAFVGDKYCWDRIADEMIGVYVKGIESMRRRFQ